VKLDEMENALSNMLDSEKNVPNIYTMNSILWAYGNHGRVGAMVKWYSELQLMGVEPDTGHSVSYGKVNMLERMMLVLKYMKYMKRRFFSPSAATFNIIMECFGRASNI
jgi:pentatricopeptide repeat protein